MLKFITLFFSILVYSQEIPRNTISVVGNSNLTSNGYYVSQSVGQLSTIGFSEMFDKSIVQGYQSKKTFIIESLIKYSLRESPL
jgi:hypothetical protein